MASEFSEPPHAQPQPPAHDTMQTEDSQPTLLTNGDHEISEKDMSRNEAINNDAFAANANLPAAPSTIEAPSAPEPNPSGPTPTDNFTAPPTLSEIIAKEQQNNAHPTPPPDAPVAPAVEAAKPDVPDVEMRDSEAESKPVEASPPLSTEPSLIRPREDDDDGERAAKRSRVEEESKPEPEVPGLLAAVATPAQPAPSTEPAVPEPAAPAAEPAVKDVQPVSETQTPAPVSEVQTPAPAQPSSEAPTPAPVQPASEAPTPAPVQPASEVVTPAPVEPSSDAAAPPPSEPSAISTPVEAAPSVATQPQAPEVKTETAEPNSQSLNATPQPTSNGESSNAAVAAPSVAQQSTEADAKPSIESGAVAQPPATAEGGSKFSTKPLTPAQKAFLIDKWKNIKKTKHAGLFLRPVDYALLNIPNYPNVIKTPMDLGTMEQKLKDDKYASVQDFVNDFELIVNNTRTFNGPAHVVTQTGEVMKAYFDKFMEMVPSTDQPLPVKASKKRSPSISKAPPRREPRAATIPQPPANPDTFALQPDGTPQIRRDSSINQRPARAIKPPANRELTYAKPKRKEHMLELKFCDHVLNQIRSERYFTTNQIFQHPVDPVALNIPHYRQVVKQPMDLSSMQNKLKQGQYAKASEFKKDFDLMISNCLAFNPAGNPIRDVGIQFQRQFNSLWAEKEKWERANKPESHRGSSDEESAEEEEEEEMDDDKNKTIVALQQQLLAMQSMIGELTGGGGGKAGKSKKASKKAVSKKLGSMSSAPSKSKSKSKAPKKPKQVTYEEKQEISEAVGRMDETQVNKLTQIITENCARYRDMEEMELEIDDLPNDVQALLLKYVRGLFGNPNKTAARAMSPDDVAAVDDDDFEPSSRTGGGNKRKKHKPMGKHEQGETIKTLQSRLAQFNGAIGGGGSESPTNGGYPHNQADDTSGDDESEESEEE